MVVAGPGVRALEERADAHGDVLGAAGRPGLRVAYGGEHRVELVDDGLVLGSEGAVAVAAATEATDHRAVSCSGLAVRVPAGVEVGRIGRKGRASCSVVWGGSTRSAAPGREGRGAALRGAAYWVASVTTRN
ncbi:hypothetical protein ALMP_23720 [Streptomyces sp. A012304]|nr:hypothetical protein ALMP_23720 [Streptomyces sp. A012304]